MTTTDNGFLIIDKVRIPRENMLMGFAKVMKFVHLHCSWLIHLTVLALVSYLLTVFMHYTHVSILGNIRCCRMVHTSGLIMNA